MEKQLCVQRNIIDIYNCMYGSDARVARTINEPINALDSGLVAALWPAYRWCINQAGQGDLHSCLVKYTFLHNVHESRYNMNYMIVSSLFCVIQKDTLYQNIAKTITTLSHYRASVWYVTAEGCEIFRCCVKRTKRQPVNSRCPNEWTWRYIFLDVNLFALIYFFILFMCTHIM